MSFLANVSQPRLVSVPDMPHRAMDMTTKRVYLNETESELGRKFSGLFVASTLLLPFVAAGNMLYRVWKILTLNYHPTFVPYIEPEAINVMERLRQTFPTSLGLAPPSQEGVDRETVFKEWLNAGKLSYINASELTDLKQIPAGIKIRSADTKIPGGCALVIDRTHYGTKDDDEDEEIRAPIMVPTDPKAVTMGGLWAGMKADAKKFLLSIPAYIAFVVIAFYGFFNAEHARKLYERLENAVYEVPMLSKAFNMDSLSVQECLARQQLLEPLD